MNRSGWRPHLVALLTAMLTCICLLSLSTAPAWAAAGTITTFPLPTKCGRKLGCMPLGITAGPDSNV